MMKTFSFSRAALISGLVLSGPLWAMGIAAGNGGCVGPAASGQIAIIEDSGLPVCAKPGALDLDPQLQAALCKALGIEGSHSLLPSDLDHLTGMLDLSNKGIQRLDGLEYADQVTCLNLAHNEIVDMLPLLGMDRLEAVSVAYNQIDFNNSQSAQAVSRGLKSALVFVDEGIDTQKAGNLVRFKLQVDAGKDVLTIPTRAGVGYCVKGEVVKDNWETLSALIKGTGGDVIQTYDHHISYRVEPLSSKYILQKDPSENPRYKAYLDNMHYQPGAMPDSYIGIFSGAYNALGNNWEGLWFSDARDWYHDRTQYFDALISDYRESVPSRENAADAFRLRAALRSEARLLMGNQTLAKQFLPDRNQTFDEFEVYTRGKLEKKLGYDPSQQEIYIEIIRTAKTSNDSWDSYVGTFDKALEYVRSWGWGVVAPESKNVPLPANSKPKVGR